MIFGAARSRRPRTSSRTRPSVGRAYDGEPLPPRLVPSLRQLVSTVVSLAHTRLALAGLELEEEMQRLIRAVALSLVALLLGFMAIIVATFTIVAAVEPEHRVLAMVVITLLYLIGAVIAVARVRGIFSSRPPIFSATLAELEKDRETLSQMSRAAEAGEPRDD